MATLQIPSRFNGPPGSGNGGYVGGLLAEHHGDAAVTVILRSPTPLDTPLEMRAGSLYDGDTLVAESRVGEFDRDAPQSEVPPKWWTGGYAAEVAARSDRS
ncbi:hypothetical protein ACQPW1_06690 [Nocardia sp. CA-128927]|uniref:hypothetical protein n=1 Tax=Nocardia sp. CA-128927 TaxID=3239975 RepID=UPI003D9696D5